MESIFESLENLNVSEECFKDILSRIEEDLRETIKRANGGSDRKYWSKAFPMRSREISDASNREGRPIEQIYDKRKVKKQSKINWNKSDTENLISSVKRHLRKNKKTS